MNAVLTQGQDDPLTLDLLSSELHSHPGSPDSPKIDLPILLPLSHNHPHLDVSSHDRPFEVDEFLLTRASHTTLPDLRTELRDYLAKLKEELVGLINRDYGDFVSLGTDLRGEGERLERLGKPIPGMKQEVEKAKGELDDVKAAVRDRLTERAALREEKALLQLLLTLSDSLVRLESLLAIASPPSEDPDMPTISGKMDFVAPVTSRGGKHLARVASEYLQLLYHADKARGEGCAFVDSNRWRIDRIKTTLSRDLDNLFTTLLTSSASQQTNEGFFASNTTDRGRRMPELNEVLRTYDALGEWRQAEEVLRREVVRPFIRSTLHSTALTAPLSPLLPRTPFLLKSFKRTSITEALISPPLITPGTGTPGLMGAFNPQAPLLLTEDTPLAAVYNQLLRFADRELAGLIDASERISNAHKGRRNPNETPVENGKPEESDNRFEFLANVFWAETAGALMDEMGGQLFAAGRPDEFLVNYHTTSAFLHSLESLAPSLTSVFTIRSHPARKAFDRRWQLPVYFQLRWKEIVGGLEDALSGNPITGDNWEGFKSPQSDAVWKALERCWSEDVFVLELGERFWRLTLQILSRYRTWLAETAPAEILDRPALSLAEKRSASPALSGVPSRSSTPHPPTTPDATKDSGADDDETLRKDAYNIIDMKHLEEKVWDLYDRIGGLLEEAEEDDETAKETLQSSLAHLLSRIPSYQTQILQILTKRCADPLRHVRSIASQYRAMSNKREPTEPSYFVPGIMRPVKLFFDKGGPGEALKGSYGSAWATEIFDDLCQRYTAILVDMKKTEDSLRRFKQGKKSAFSLFGSSTASAKEEEGKDEERVKKQMFLDVTALGKDAETLGVDARTSESFKGLMQTIGMAEATV
ncbi:COG complex component [Dacryopinax primogenitus]|uniref:Conserved oligomeric Golgi complex subunit 2 n=1 Tax=Dacryopinax primogenitus (strain DJM 731) TaxID=1858805 RepID=M5GFS1_DACPD|nr:COG complex component [Dacryopinax primogenitus]EJU04373.1 COG complex component [Dacryopinax primogenitus]